MRESKALSATQLVQGKPAVRRRRKARDLPRRPPGCRGVVTGSKPKESYVKANLARFTLALALVASMALTLGAGMRW